MITLLLALSERLCRNLPHDHDVGHPIQATAHALAKERVVVGYQHADGILHAPSSLLSTGGVSCSAKGQKRPYQGATPCQGLYSAPAPKLLGPLAHRAHPYPGPIVLPYAPAVVLDLHDQGLRL